MKAETTFQLANLSSFEQQAPSPPYYQQYNEFINKIVDTDCKYYYCQCQKVRSLRYHDTVIIISERISNSNFYLSHYVLENGKIRRSLDDLKMIKQVKACIELPILTDVIHHSEVEVELIFNTSEPVWKLKFSSVKDRTLWIRMLNRKQYELKNRTIQINSLQFSKIIEINDLLSTQFNQVKKILMSTVEENEYLKNIIAFQSNFAVLGLRLDKLCLKVRDKVENFKEKMDELQSKDETAQKEKEEKQRKYNELQDKYEQLKKKYETQEETRRAETEQFRKSIERLKSQSTLSQTSLQERLAQIQEESTLKFQGIRATQETVKKSLQSQIQQLASKNRQLEANNKQLEAKNSQLEAKCKFYEQQISSLNTVLNQTKEISFTHQQRLKQLTKKYEEIELQSLFQGDILHNFLFHKDFLKQSVQSYTKNKIENTRLIFKYDRHNKTNFHVYIDNLPNIVIVIKLVNGSYIAGYTQDPFSPTVNPFPKNRGLIIGLTTQKVFPVLQGRRAISYDEYYIIFGNSQIRLKSQQQKVFSNFAISNGYYSSNNCKIDNLFGQSSREVVIEGYDIYQIYFKA